MVYKHVWANGLQNKYPDTRYLHNKYNFVRYSIFVLYVFKHYVFDDPYIKIKISITFFTCAILKKINGYLLVTFFKTLHSQRCILFLRTFIFNI